jgi:FkbM family methyltransferase
MTKALKERLLARMCSGSMASFRKMHMKFCPDDIRNMKISFSQHGEDLVIYDHLHRIKPAERGIYVDAGCFDPSLFSNTRLLSLMGWRGINIDADSFVIEKFNAARPRDTNICAALSCSERELHYVSTGALFSARLVAEENLPNVPNPITNSMKVRTLSLDSVLRNTQKNNETIDFLDIDCEDHDLEVLRGIDLNRHHPHLISIEAHTISQAKEQEDFLAGWEYELVARCGPSLIFRNKRWFREM